MGKYYVLDLSRMGSTLMYKRIGISLPPGHYHISKKSTFEPPCYLTHCWECKTEVHVGSFTGTQGAGQEGILTLSRIGRYCSIAKHVKTWLGQHPVNWLSSSSRQYFKYALGWHNYTQKEVQFLKDFDDAPLTEIGNDVWIGNGACIMGGLKIGDGAIIGTNAVVTKDVPPYAIVGGVPAKIIRYRFDEETIKQLLELQWWRYDIADFGEVDWNDVHKAIASVRKRIDGGLKCYAPKILTGKDMLAYSKRTLFFFEWSRESIRIKIFGLWLVHIVFDKR